MRSRHVSAAFFAFIRSVEGCVLHVYRDSRGKPTIGFGHLLTPAELASGVFAAGITLEQAIELFQRDIDPREHLVCSVIAAELGDHQYDAMTSYTYNWGHVPPEIAALVNAPGGWSDDELRPLWLANTRAGDDPKALVLRRAREWALWRTPDPLPDGPTADEIAAECILTGNALARELLAEHQRTAE